MRSKAIFENSTDFTDRLHPALANATRQSDVGDGAGASGALRYFKGGGQQ